MAIPLVLIILYFITKLYLTNKIKQTSKQKNLQSEELKPYSVEINKTESTIQGFSVDEPVLVDKDFDILNRMKFIKNLAKMILKTNSINGSFSIGIVAPWGSGKTTFIRTLKKELENELLIIEMDVWRCKSTDQIIESFFDLLKEKLKPYSFTINNKIKEYSKSLTSSSGNSIVGNISNYLFSDKPVEQQYEILKKEIELINKKVVVVIDDIDRLDKREIYETIRLIRNTANFSNIFFIVAYDRNYILNAIEAINPYNANTFLEKVFQVEFSLSPIELEILNQEIKSRITFFLSQNDREEFINFSRNGLQYEFERVNLTPLFIKNMRDVVRFVNLFQINYQFLKGEIFIEDFYNLQLIRFKHPDIYNEFYNKKSSFLFLSTRKNYYPQKYTYGLVMKENLIDKSLGKESALKLFLQSKKGVYKINDDEIEIITNSFMKIFPNHNNPNFSTRNVFLSVVQPSIFDRYFAYGIENKLSIIEFSKVRNMDLEVFINKILEWGKNKNIKDDLVKYLLEIKDFDDTEDFEKIIQGIFHLGQIININLTYLQEMFLSEGNKVLKLHYENNVQRMKEFILGLFMNAKSPFIFESRVLRFLDERYHEPGLYLIAQKEINNISINYLKTYSAKIEKIDSELWGLFWDSKRTSYTARNKTEKFPDEAKSIMINFIITKDLISYLVGNIEPEPFNNIKVRLRENILNLFDTWENFEIIIANQNNKEWEGLEEFKIFFYEAKKAGFSSFISFEFDKLQLKFGKLY